MASRAILDINSNDELHAIIQKCNTNFKWILTQLDSQGRTVDVKIDDDVASLVQAIENEAQVRFDNDTGIESEIHDLSNRVDDIIETGGEPNVIEEIDVNGTALVPINKGVNIIIPVSVSDLVNDEGFQKASDVLSAIAAALANSGNAYQTANDVAVAISTAFAGSGWSALDLNADVVAYNTARTPQLRKVGEMVNVTGAVKPAAQVTSGGSVLIATLPDGCRPQQEVDILCQGSSNTCWNLKITTDGKMTAERYRNGATAAAIPTTAWLTFNAVFFAA